MSYPVTTKGDNTVPSYLRPVTYTKAANPQLLETVGTLCSYNGQPLSPNLGRLTLLSSV